MNSPRDFFFFHCYRGNPDDIEVLTISLPPCDRVHLYPACLVMSAFIAIRNELFKDKHIIEIGAGAGAPSITAALVGANCLITDREDQVVVMEELHESIKINKLDPSKVTIMPLHWGHLSKETLSEITSRLPNLEVCIGSDVLYTGEDFDPLLATIESLMTINPHLIFYTTYEERCPSRTLVPYLDKYGLDARVIPLDSFMHSAHEEGVVLVRTKKGRSCRSETESMNRKGKGEGKRKRGKKREKVGRECRDYREEVNDVLEGNEGGMKRLKGERVELRKERDNDDGNDKEEEEEGKEEEENKEDDKAGGEEEEGDEDDDSDDDDTNDEPDLKQLYTFDNIYLIEIKRL